MEIDILWILAALVIVAIVLYITESNYDGR